MSSFVAPTPVDHAVDLAAAAVPAVAAGWAAMMLAPFDGLGVLPVAAFAGIAAFVPCYSVMRMSGRKELSFVVPAFRESEQTPRVRTFSPPPFEEELLLDDVFYSDEGGEGAFDGFADVRLHFAAAFDGDDDVLLLEDEVSAGDVAVPVDQPDFDRRVEELSELLLDDPLTMPTPDSRVVRLFAPQPLPTPGDLANRIVRHIEDRGTPKAVSAPDASIALNEALDSLRQSIRRA